MSLYLLSLLPLLAVALAGVTPQSGSTYTISPKKFSNLCLAPSGTTDGSKLVTKDCDTSDDIVWTYSSGVFKNTATNMCVDVKDGGNWSGNKLQVWTCFNQNRNQVFAQSGENIKWSGRDLCWDLTDGKSSTGNQIQLWSCFDHNDNQMWEFVEAEEVDSCDSVATNSLVTTTATATATLGGVLLVEGTSTSSSKTGGGKHQKPTGSSDSTTASSATTTTSSTSTASSAVATSTGKATTGSGDTSKYLQTSGTKIVDSNGNNVIWKGVNLGGWLVSEDWMNGITDYSGNADRFMQNTLENRFGADKTKTLLNAWYDNFLTSSDWDSIAAMGYNSVRLPFGWRNLQNADGSWITDASGNIDFSRLDWAVAQAKQRNIWIVLVFHIWDTQQQQYSMISENTADGQSSRDRAGKIWNAVATHFLGEPIIAAYDAINEPTGSWGDLLQQDLYKAIRAVDSKKIIVMESISTNPSNYGWTNVVYSWHEYNCMGDNYGANQGTIQSGLVPTIKQWWGYNIPAYLGEFMADGQTLTYILDQMNGMGVSWHSWTWKTVNMGRWGLYNLGEGARVTVSSDSYDSILAKWSNLGSLSRQAVTSQFASAMRKRDMASPRAGIKASSGHSRRSRTGMVMAHGKKSTSF